MRRVRYPESIRCIALVFWHISVAFRIAKRLQNNGVSRALNTADRYAQIRAIPRIREPALFAPLRIPTELELQARWFAGDFGKRFVSIAGDKIDIVQFDS